MRIYRSVITLSLLLFAFNTVNGKDQIFIIRDLIGKYHDKQNNEIIGEILKEDYFKMITYFPKNYNEFRYCFSSSFIGDSLLPEGNGFVKNEENNNFELVKKFLLKGKHFLEDESIYYSLFFCSTYGRDVNLIKIQPGRAYFYFDFSSLFLGPETSEKSIYYLLKLPSNLRHFVLISILDTPVGFGEDLNVKLIKKMYDVEVFRKEIYGILGKTKGDKYFEKVRKK